MTTPTLSPRSLAMLALGTLLVTACDDSSNPPPPQPSDDAAEPAGPTPAEPAAEAPADDGRVAYLANTLAAVTGGKAVDVTETSNWGCSVKYADTAAEVEPAKIGEPAPDFELVDLDGNKFKLSEHKGKTVVLEWFNPGCPFVVQAHSDDGVLATMAKEYGDEGIVWVGINSGAPGKQGHGVDTNKKAASEWGIGHPILVDESGTVGRSYGAKSTPHMFVIDPEGKLVYRGAPDNAPMGEVKS